ncbi:MAG: hypothetical protein QG629_385 [Patescibacteria group bacterium]|nr:hypothetical protein [Patescibacteria group bacterium]MDQ5963303.1 hypothetical protein [Patescibacteria group bacterium]
MWSYLRKNYVRVILLTSITLFGLLSFWLLTTTLYNVIVGDDMVYVRRFEQMSIFDSTKAYYESWTARITNVVVLGVIFSIIPVKFLSLIGLPISLFGLLASSAIFFWSILRKFQLKAQNIYTPVALLSLVFTLCLMLFSRVPYSDFYWIAGIVTYTLPIIFSFLLGAFVILRGQDRRISLFSGLLLTIASLLVSLLNEAYLLQLSIVLFLIFVGILLLARRFNFYLFVLLAGQAFGALVFKLSPGTKARMQVNDKYYEQTHDIGSLVSASIKTTFHELGYFISHNLFGLLCIGLLCVAIGYIIAKTNALRHTRYKSLFVWLGFGVLLPFISFFVLAFAFHYAYQPAITDYSLITGNLFAYLGIVVAGAVLGIILYRQTQAHVVTFLWLALTPALLIVSVMLGFKIFHINRLMILQKNEYAQTRQLIMKGRSKGEKIIDIGQSTHYFSYCSPDINPEVWCNKSYEIFFGTPVKASSYVDAELLKSPYGLE